MAVSAALGLTFAVQAEDWPQWRGPQRDAVWHETGILETFPPEGLKVLWRVPVGVGFSSPSIAGGRVFVTDSQVTQASTRENIHCLDAITGQTIWTHTYDVQYPEWGADPAHPFGPTATPVIANGKVYTVGRGFDLLCLDALTGRVLWHHNLPKLYQAKDDLRGFSGSPIVEGDLLILAIAKSPQACLVAFDKDSGRQVWEALDEIPSDSSPIVIQFAGRRQLIYWAYKSVAALDPMSGEILWRESVNTGPTYTAATPVWNADRLLLGGLMLKLNADPLGVSILWPDDPRPLRVHVSDTSTALLQDGLVFAPTSKGFLRCLDAGTGQQQWETNQVTELKSGASIHLTAAPHIKSVFIYTDRGDLILTKLSADRYQEIGRFHLLDPTYEFGGRKMAWPPPAFSGRCVFARSDRELVCASLAAQPISGSVEYHTNQLEGWTVLVDSRLIRDQPEVTTKALQLLRGQLQEVVRVVPEPALRHLRKVTLWFSPPYPGVTPRAEYHPDVGWLRANRRNPAMARGIEYTDIANFEAESRRMPNFTLHELAHAYHDRVLPEGFANADLKSAFERAKASGRYDQVERKDAEGRVRLERAYALTDPMEYFAESTEAYFSQNDFFPFNRQELRQVDPEMEELLGRLWGTMTKSDP